MQLDCNATIKVKTLSDILFTVLGIPLTLFSILYRAYALSICWLWFVVPTIKVSPINTFQIMGLGLFVNTLIYNPKSIKLLKRHLEETSEYRWREMYYPLIRTTLVLSIGWLIKTYLL